MLLLVALVGGAAVVAGRTLLAGATAVPVMPPEVAPAASGWSGPVELPVTLPACLRYAPGAAVVPDSQAGSGWALTLRLVGNDTPGCAGWQDASVLVQESASLGSLTGEVTTVSANRMQFARTADAAGAAQSTVTLQWRCRDLMCRVSAALGGPLDEATLVQLAANFAQLPQ